MPELRHVEDHCRRILRRSRESYAEHARDEAAPQEPPRIEDLELWEACGIDWPTVNREVHAETPCVSCGRLAGDDPGAHLVGCGEVPDA